MAREKDCKLRRRKQRRNKLRKLKARLMETKEQNERERLLDKISRIMVFASPEALKKLEKELRP